MLRTALLTALLSVISFLCAETAARSYPVPNPYLPITWQSHDLKGRVKSYTIRTDGNPDEYQTREYTEDGKLLRSVLYCAGHIYETSFWYDAHGWMIKSLANTSIDGVASEPEVILYQYEFDRQGYPLIVKELSASGEALVTHSYEYADSVYSLISQNLQDSEEDSYITVYLFNSRGEVTARTVFDVSKSRSERYTYAYIPDQSITIESSDYQEGVAQEKVVTRKNNLGKVLERSVYDAEEHLISKLECEYDPDGKLITESWYFPSYQSMDVTSYEYELDATGNVLVQRTHSDGEDDELKMFSYEYY